MTRKKIAASAIVALKEALTNIYWYKSDLRSFLTSALTNPALLSRLDWSDCKRNIIGRLVDFMRSNEDKFQRDLLNLMAEVASIDDFSHLKRLEDGDKKAKLARESVLALIKLVSSSKEFYEEQRKIEERRETAKISLKQKSMVQEKLNELTDEYYALLGSKELQKRGFKLEKIIKELFEIFDLDPKASFKITGEQIDGAFSFDGTDYLFEGRWQKGLVIAKDLDSLSGKLSRKLDNTLGLFLSINGYSPGGIEAHSSGRRLIILMDGSDLMAVLEGRIKLDQLLLRKRRHASQTGNIYLRIHEILT